jgi:hypothetical protein
MRILGFKAGNAASFINEERAAVDPKEAGFFDDGVNASLIGRVPEYNVFEIPDKHRNAYQRGLNAALCALNIYGLKDGRKVFETMENLETAA